MSFLNDSAPSVVKFSLTVYKNLKWSVSVFGRPVPRSNDLYTEFPILVTSVENIVMICNSIEQRCICEGNNDDEFVSILKVREV